MYHFFTFQLRGGLGRGGLGGLEQPPSSSRDMVSIVCKLQDISNDVKAAIEKFAQKKTPKKTPVSLIFTYLAVFTKVGVVSLAKCFTILSRIHPCNSQPFSCKNR